MMVWIAIGSFIVPAGAYLWFTRKKSVDRNPWDTEANDNGRDLGRGGCAGGLCGGGGI